MLLDDLTSVKAALATMNPTAREATQLLAYRVSESPGLLEDNELLKQEALQACAISFARSGKDPSENGAEFMRFLEDHGSNVVDIAVSAVLCLAKSAQRRKKWGKVAAVASLVGAAALGSIFG